jgi:hypothetical protein
VSPGATAKVRRLLCLQFYLSGWRGFPGQLGHSEAPAHRYARRREFADLTRFSGSIFGFICGKPGFGGQNAIEIRLARQQNSAQKKLPHFHLGHPIVRCQSFLLTTMLDAATKRI